MFVPMFAVISMQLVKMASVNVLHVKTSKYTVQCVMTVAFLTRTNVSSKLHLVNRREWFLFRNARVVVWNIIFFPRLHVFLRPCDTLLCLILIGSNGEGVGYFLLFIQSKALDKPTTWKMILKQYYINSCLQTFVCALWPRICTENLLETPYPNPSSKYIWWLIIF